MSRWTDAPPPGEFGGICGCNRESGMTSNGYWWGGVVGVGLRGKMKTQKTAEAGGAEEIRNKVNDSNRA